MALTRIVNGEEIAISPEEEAEIRAEWAANDQAVIDKRLAEKKAKLAELTKNKALEAMVIAKLKSIDSMTEADIDVAIQSGGL